VRVGAGSSRHRRYRAGVECLEDRRLLSAITEFPLFYWGGLGDLTVGPDGNLWFPEYAPSLDGFYPTSAIGRITPSGAVTSFDLHPGVLMVGPEGNLWFPLADHRGIGRITPSGTITEFPLPSASFQPSPYGLTVGPDGNLWFGATSVSGSAVIGRITPSGAVTEFPLPTTSGDPGPLTVGPDGNLWFNEGDENTFYSNAGTNVIGRINPSPPRVTGVVAVAHSRAGTTEIVLSFNEALDPRTTGRLGSYHLAAGVKTRHTLVFSKGLKIARVFYDGSTHQVTLKLAVPQKGPVQVTVRAGIVAADGMSSFSDFTAVVR
jgi:streptogramin lyase